MATVDRATKVRGGTEAARATLLEEGGVHRYQTIGVVTVELPMARCLRSIDSRLWAEHFSRPNVTEPGVCC
jgi:hypothetical protein